MRIPRSPLRLVDMAEVQDGLPTRRNPHTVLVVAQGLDSMHKASAALFVFLTRNHPEATRPRERFLHIMAVGESLVKGLLCCNYGGSCCRPRRGIRGWEGPITMQESDYCCWPFGTKCCGYPEADRLVQDDACARLKSVTHTCC